jgi:hypothetical protein
LALFFARPIPHHSVGRDPLGPDAAAGSGKEVGDDGISKTAEIVPTSNANPWPKCQPMLARDPTAIQPKMIH